MEHNLKSKPIVGSVAVAVAIVLAGSVAIAASGGAQWSNVGGDLQNTRSQPSESKLTVSNVGSLTQKWAFTTGGDVSATPAVDGNNVYVPDWAGNLYAINKKTGQQIWKVSIAEASGAAGDKARVTPTVTDDKVIVGTQGGILAGGGPGGKVLAFDKFTGALLWSTTARLPPGRDHHAVGDRLQRQGVRGCGIPGGSARRIRSRLCAELPREHARPRSQHGRDRVEDLHGPRDPNGLHRQRWWGSSPAIDAKRNQVYIATGNNYSVPDDVLQCVADAAGDPDEQSACLPGNDYFDSILALDLNTGAVRWATRAIPYDAGPLTASRSSATAISAPIRRVPDYDFGQAPALFTVKPAVTANPKTLSGPVRRAGSTGHSTPTLVRFAGSPRPDRVAPLVDCSGVLPSTGSACTRPTPTATSSRGPCLATPSRPRRVCGVGSTP